MPAKLLQSCPTLCEPMDCGPTRLLCQWGFFRQEYWSGLPCPLPEDLPDPGIKAMSPLLTGEFFSTEPPGKPPMLMILPK